MSQPYILYSSPDSANLVIRMLLHEMGATFDTVWVDRCSREHKQDKYLAMNPQGLIPVLVDNGQPIFETAAIALHLCDKHGLLMPEVGPGRARFLQWLFYLSNTPHADLRARNRSDEYIGNGEGKAALLAALARRFAGHLQLVESELAANDAGPWFLGASLTALDIYFAVLCRWWQLYPIDSAAAPISAQALPHIHRLLSELGQRPAIAQACAEERITAPYFIRPKLPDLPLNSITG